MDKTWEKKFDWIVIVDVLHDLPNPDACLAEVKRVHKDDGVVSTIMPIKK
jgi:ubiquinone/menaquinone biosynthesis C-methylase UbiE